MERAGKAIRRSGVKLLSLSQGHSDLNLVISEQKCVRNSAKAFMEAQNQASQYVMKWSANSDNRALQDVSNQIVELNLLWTEAQREFTEHLKEFKHMFDLVLEGEKHVDQAKNNLAACEMREMKIKKELKKAAKKASPEELRVLEHRLGQAERQKDLAQIEVQDKIRENDAIKLIRFKDGMLKLSTAYMELGRNCAIIFEAQRNISYQLPDMNEKDIDEIKYTGSGATKHYVVQAKERVRQYKRQSQSGAVPNKYADEPPPPYTPGDYYEQHIDQVPLDMMDPLTSHLIDLPLTSSIPPHPQQQPQRPTPQPRHSRQQPQPQQPHLPQQLHYQDNNGTTTQRRPLSSHQHPPQQRQPSLDLAEDLDWGSEDEVDDMSGAMGGLKL